MTRTISRKTATLLAALALAALAGCTAMEKSVGQCEGGVSDLSTLSSVTVQNPC